MGVRKQLEGWAVFFHHVGPWEGPRVITEPPHQTFAFPRERREHGHDIVLGLPTSHIFIPVFSFPTLAFICSPVLRVPATLTQPLLVVEASARSTMWLLVCLSFCIWYKRHCAFYLLHNILHNIPCFLWLIFKISLKRGSLCWALRHCEMSLLCKVSTEIPSLRLRQWQGRWVI